jgi:acetylglutamate kinase
MQQSSTIPARQQLYVVKIGGNIIDDDQKLNEFLASFASVQGAKILVHGGGKLATRLAADLKIPQQMVDGRRITDAETLKIVTMVYAGYINKNIVAKLQAIGVNAIGLSGVDGNLVRSHKRVNANLDFGYVGDVDEVNATLLQTLLGSEMVPVIAPITHDRQGLLLNTNADTIAQVIAVALGEQFYVNLVYSFEKAGVLKDAEDESTVIPKIDPVLYETLRSDGSIYAGMIPKLDNAFNALKTGVSRVIIGRAEKLPALIDGSSGTSIVL